jgi:hypothetical protein
MLDSSLHVPVEHSKTDIRCIALPSLWNQPLLRNTEKAGENMNVSTVRKTNAVDCTLSLEPQPFMQGKASRNILTLRLISLLDSFYFPSEQFIHCVVCKPVNSPPSGSQARQAALSFGPRKSTTTNHQPSRYVIQPTATAREQNLRFLQPTRLI